METVEVIKIKPKRQPISVVLQIVFTLCVLVLGIITLFKNEVLPFLYISLSLDLSVMAWNHIKLSKKKKTAILYIVFAVITLVSAIMELFL